VWNIVTNVYAKSNYKQLQVNNILGTFANLTTATAASTTTTTIFVPVVLRDPPASKHYKPDE